MTDPTPAAALSIARFVKMLEAFDVHRRPLSAAELTDALDAPRSSVAALLRSLTELGLLSTDRRTGYLPSLKLAALTAWAPALQLPHNNTMTRIAALADSLGETAVLWRARDAEVEVAFVFESASPIALRLEQGARFPMIGTAAGLALMAMQDSAARTRTISRLVGGMGGDEGLRAARDIAASVLAVRKIGYAEVYGALGADVGAIVAPLKGSSEALQMAVGIGGPATRIRKARQRIVSALKGLTQRS
jgi:DNA-binding IclR family transcriptional regulator